MPQSDTYPVLTYNGSTTLTIKFPSFSSEVEFSTLKGNLHQILKLAERNTRPSVFLQEGYSPASHRSREWVMSCSEDSHAVCSKKSYSLSSLASIL